LGSGSSNMLEFFDFEKKIQNFCLPGLGKKFWVTNGGNNGRRERLE
jgi:hypothetical protein